MAASQDFDGSTEYLFSNDSNSVASALSDYPVSQLGWIYWNTLPGAAVPFGLFRNIGVSNNDFIRILSRSSGKLRANIRVNGGVEYGTESSNTVSTGKWYFVCQTHASSTDHKLFVDGTNWLTGTTDVGSFPTLSRTSIGRTYRGSITTEYHDGKVAHYQVYDKVLSIDEQNEISNNPIALPSNLKCYIPLMENGTVATDFKDLTGNGFGPQSGTVPTNSPSGPPIHFPQMQG